MKNRLGRMKNRLMAPDMRKLSSELKAPGEMGRAIPGAVQAQVMAQAQSSSPVLQPDVPASSGRTEIFTYFTKV